MNNIVLGSGGGGRWLGINNDGDCGSGVVLVMVVVVAWPDKMVLDKMVRTKWYGQNGTDKMVAISI